MAKKNRYKQLKEIINDYVSHVLAICDKRVELQEKDLALAHQELTCFSVLQNNLLILYQDDQQEKINSEEIGIPEDQLALQT